METNTQIIATCRSESGTFNFNGDFSAARVTLGTLRLPSLLYGTWQEEESQARALVPRAHHLAVTPEVFEMERDPRIGRFRDAYAARHPSIGCFSLAMIPKVLGQRDIKFDMESSSTAVCAEEYKQMNTLCNLFAVC